MSEETLVKTMPLPFNQKWAWHADSNVVVLSPDLDDVGRDQALNELYDHWRRSCIRVVGGDAVPVFSVPRSGSPIRQVIEAL